MGDVLSYLQRLRGLVPGRTLGFYVSANGFFGAFGKPEDIPAALIFVVVGLALAIHIGGGIATRKGGIPVLLSAIAFVLLALSQPFYGPLAAMGVTSPIAQLAVALIALAYLTILPMVYKGDLAAQG
jgi:hypothetical protein